MSTPAEAGRLSQIVFADIGWDVPGMLAELEDLPKKRYQLRQKIAPLKAELAMLKARFQSRGVSPSLWDVRRGMLLSQLKEEARQNYAQNPDVKQNAKGEEVPIPLTDGRAEDAAHADPRYVEFIEESERERKRMVDIGKQMGALFDKLEVWAGREKFLTVKLEQAKALTYSRNAETRLV